VHIALVCIKTTTWQDMDPQSEFCRTMCTVHARYSLRQRPCGVWFSFHVGANLIRWVTLANCKKVYTYLLPTSMPHHLQNCSTVFAVAFPGCDCTFAALMGIAALPIGLLLCCGKTFRAEASVDFEFFCFVTFV
jgi:hypothetical protein